MNDQAGGAISSANVATLGISDYLGMLQRHWFIANLILFAAVGGAIAWVSQQDEV